MRSATVNRNDAQDVDALDGWARDGFYCLFKGETLGYIFHRGQKDRVYKRSAHRVESSLLQKLILPSFEMRFPFLNRQTRSKQKKKTVTFYSLRILKRIFNKNRNKTKVHPWIKLSNKYISIRTILKLQRSLIIESFENWRERLWDNQTIELTDLTKRSNHLTPPFERVITTKQFGGGGFCSISRHSFTRNDVREREREREQSVGRKDTKFKRQ